MGGRFAAISAVVAIVLLGCAGCGRGGGGDDPATPTNRPASTLSTPVTSAPTGPTTPPPPSVPADVPTTGPNLLKPGEQPPVMPIEATKHTPEGAVAFARFFELTIDWAYATTSTTYMKHYYAATCITCESIREGVDKAAAQGHHFIGGRMTVVSAVGLSASDSPTPRAEAGARVVFKLTSSEVLDDRNEFVDADIARTLTDDVWFSWLDGRWLVVEIVPIP